MGWKSKNTSKMLETRPIRILYFGICDSMATQTPKPSSFILLIKQNNIKAVGIFYLIIFCNFRFAIAYNTFSSIISSSSDSVDLGEKMDSNFLTRVLERAKSKDFAEQFALWGSAAAVSYLVYWHFLGKAAHDDREALGRRLIQVILLVESLYCVS